MDTRREFKKLSAAKYLKRETTMDAIRKILVPTDFSAYGDEAFRVAHTLARALGADVIVVHVAQAPAVVSDAGRLQTDPRQGNTANLWHRFQNTQAKDPKVRVEHEVIVADRPGAAQILEILDKLGCDLIVMGTHGHSWLKHLLLGSVTEQVVRRARFPVMLVKAPSPAVDAPAPEAAVASGA
jgi:nucleotide-binding universal stress UspA family protein